MNKLYIALLHYPVVNKTGETIASAVTNLDLHDIARAARTYGVCAYYVVTPLEDQKVLVKKIVSHWEEGFGAAYNPARKEALGTIHIYDTLEAVVDHITGIENEAPKTVATSANLLSGSISYEQMREKLKSGKPYLLLFGTAWGFPEDFLARADDILAPIKGCTDYNHLSVRSAASIILDRLTSEYS